MCVLSAVENIPTQLLTHLTQMSRTVAKSQKGYQINAGPFSQGYQSPFKAQSNANAICAAARQSLWGLMQSEGWAASWLAGYQVLHLVSHSLINFALAQVVVRA